VCFSRGHVSRACLLGCCCMTVLTLTTSSSIRVSISLRTACKQPTDIAMRKLLCQEEMEESEKKAQWDHRREKYKELSHARVHACSDCTWREELGFPCWGQVERRRGRVGSGCLWSGTPRVFQRLQPYNM
jgi:hypothetical protein